MMSSWPVTQQKPVRDAAWVQDGVTSDYGNLSRRACESGAEWRRAPGLRCDVLVHPQGLEP